MFLQIPFVLTVGTSSGRWISTFHRRYLFLRCKKEVQCLIAAVLFLFGYTFKLLELTFLFAGAGARQPTYLVTADDVDSVLAIEVQPLDDRKRKVYLGNTCWSFLNAIFFWGGLNSLVSFCLLCDIR